MIFFPALSLSRRLPHRATSPGRFTCTIAALLLCVTLFVAMSPRQAHAFWELNYLTEEYYPFNYTEDGTLKGISVELLHLVWRELGVEPQPIESMPWARAYDRVQNISSTVLFTMARTHEREHLFRWAGPITTVRFVLIAKKGRDIPLSFMDTPDCYRVGTLRDDVSESLLDKYGKKFKAESVADMRQNIKKLITDRVDMVAYEERSWKKIAIKNDLSPDDFEIVYVLQETPVYYAFNRDVSPPEIQKFQEALNRVKATPQYQEILDRHLH